MAITLPFTIGTQPGPTIPGSDFDANFTVLANAINAISATPFVQMVNFETGAVATGTTIIPQDDTIPQNTEGDQYMSLAITPTNAASLLLIDVTAVLSNSAVAGNSLIAALFQDTTANALAAAYDFQNTATGVMTVHFRHKMTAGTTSSTTFKVRCGGNGAGTTTFNGNGGSRIFGGVMASSITIMEIL